MSFLSLKYFVEITREMNLSKTAERLYVSQQSLSQHVAKLEKQYGVKLFQRTTPLRLTYAGHECLQLAERMVELDRQLNEKMRGISANGTGTLQIGMSYNRSRFFFPQIILSYAKLYPNIKIECQDGNTASLEEKLITGQLDFIFYATSFREDSQINYVDILNDRLMLVIRDDVLQKYCADSYSAILKNPKEGVSLSTIQNCPLLLYLPQSHTRQALDALLQKAGIHPNIALCSENVETLFFLAGMGMGAAFCPEMYLPVLSPRIKAEIPIHFMPLKEREADSRMVIAYRQNRRLSEPDQKFIALIQEIVHKSESSQ